MLSEIKKWLKERETVSLYDLSLHFDVEESAMEKMMEMLIHKGSAEKEEIGCSGKSCAGCAINSCRSSELVFYRWIE